MAIQNIQYLKTRTLLSDKGTYLLMLESRGHLMIEVGKRGAMALEPGFYLYVGSAFGPGGIKARVGRHLSADKPLRWHIDYLRRVTTVREVCISYDPRQLESKWVDALANDGMFATPAPGFGASDSRHISHLFFHNNKPSRKKITQLLNGDGCLFFLKPQAGELETGASC